MELQQTHRKINRPIISLALVGALIGTELGLIRQMIPYTARVAPFSQP